MVTLSGGDLGGQLVSGDGWADGEVRDVDGKLYRRAGDIAVYVGLA